MQHWSNIRITKVVLFFYEVVWFPELFPQDYWDRRWVEIEGKCVISHNQWMKDQGNIDIHPKKTYTHNFTKFYYNDYNLVYDENASAVK